MLTYYNSITLDNNIIMSCDMLRLSFKMYNDKREKLVRFIYSYDIPNTNYLVREFRSFDDFKFSSLFSIRHSSGCSFSIGVGFNGVEKSSSNTCFIEFNPNKTLYNNAVIPFLDFIKIYSSGLDLVRFDLAFDIPFSKDLITLEKDIRKYSKTYRFDLHNKNMSNCTEYLGSRSSNGFVKLYNKQIESNLDYPCTRLELTLDSLKYSNFIKNLPNVCFCLLRDNSELEGLDDTDRVLYNLLINNENCIHYFKMLGRRKQEKLRPYIVDKLSTLEVSEDTFYRFVTLITNIIN